MTGAPPPPAAPHYSRSFADICVLCVTILLRLPHAIGSKRRVGCAAAMSSNLPPEDLAADGRRSRWRTFKLVVDAVIYGLSALNLHAITHADPRTHLLLADPKRTRKRQLAALHQGLS